MLLFNFCVSILQIVRNNLLNFRSVDVPIPSENPDKVESSVEGGPVLRESWKKHGLLSIDRNRLGFPEVSESDSGEEEQASSRSENAFVMNIVNPRIMQIGGDNVLNFSPADTSTPSADSSKVIEGDNEDQPVLREHWKPRGPLSVGRSRHGFPDYDNDHLVQLLVCKNQHAREALDIADN